MMNQNDIAGILQSYAWLFSHARNREHMLELVDRLKSELDKRKIRFVNKAGEQE